MSAVTTSLADIKSGKATAVLDDAFGPDSLGIIVVDGLPEEYLSLRAKVLKSASLLAKLDSEILKQMECEDAVWLVGWSLGKESLLIKKKDGSMVKKPDYLKGSYYINCSFFIDDELEGPPDEERERYKDYKAYITLNHWPDLHAVKSKVLENFKKESKALCKMIIEIASCVASVCDLYIDKEFGSSFGKDYLSKIVRNSYTTKARLLHYYPKTQDDQDTETWCGEHLDHSCLTGLTSAMFLDESVIDKKTFDEITNADVEGLKELEASPDPDAGLYIRNRHGEVVKVNIPKHCLAFQTGSALQEISNNKFKAVPHYVRGCEVKGIARNTLAVFCQPNLGDMVNEKEMFSQYADRILGENH